jgi:hypothetical protein
LLKKEVGSLLESFVIEKYKEKKGIMAEAVASQPSLVANNHALSPMRPSPQPLIAKQ